MAETSISWTNVTWNPLVGCTKVSPGCAHCYAETMAKRLRAMALADIAAGKDPGRKRHYIDAIDDKGRWTGKLIPVPEALNDPFGWRKPRMVFVNSMSDLFHESVPDYFIDKVFGVMAVRPEHTFQILTKRAERMEAYFRGERTYGGEKVSLHFQIAVRAGNLVENGDTAADAVHTGPWPLPNVWCGVSVENQEQADARIPFLLKTPAAVRFLSCEPLLGPVDIGMSTATCDCCSRWPSRWVELPQDVHGDWPVGHKHHALTGIYRANSNQHGALSVRTPNGLLGIKPAEFECLPKLDWVISGCESGPGRRECKQEWIESIQRQCELAGVVYFNKQMEVNGKVSTDMATFPTHLQVQEFPSTEAAKVC